MTEKQMLRRVRVRIGTPESWCQAATAKGEDNEPVHPNSPNAAKWCLVGAFDRVSHDAIPEDQDCEEMRKVVDARAQAKETVYRLLKLKKDHGLIGSAGMAGFNDVPTRTHGEVLDLLDAAIAAPPAETSRPI